jgi:Xaa-Pro aminopeptidase
MAFPYGADDLARFREVQRLAYDIAEEVAGALEVGMTERDASEAIAAAQQARGVEQVFHVPFAWFGARTMLGADWVAAGEAAPGGEPGRGIGFFATDATLADGAPAILDLAPVVDGYCADIGYSCIVGHNDLYEELLAGLQPMRDQLLQGVRAGTTLRTLYRELDDVIADHGWVNCHQQYPDRALGHVVMRLEAEPHRARPIPGFGVAAGEALVAAITDAATNHTCWPIWNDGEFADHPASPGLWAVEPHIGRDGVGAKYEELLVVTDDDAYWLDDDLPHHRRWAAAADSARTRG